MKRKNKRNNSAKSRTRSVLLTTLLVSIAFLLGSWTERSNLSFQWINDYVSEITEYVRTYRIPFSEDEIEENIAELYFFDVGQGASTLLQAYDGTTILIDTGRSDDSEFKIIDYLNEEIGVGGVIDLLIFTNNDADHIGNGDIVLEYFQVEEVWMNGMDHTSQTYSDLLDAMLAADVTYREPKAGEKAEVGPFLIQILHPLKDERERTQNDQSIVTRISIGKTSLVHSGDVDTEVEKRIINDNLGSLHAAIMILGHHGSSTSTSADWLEVVEPEVAVYQTVPESHYGPLHKETMEKVAGHSAELLGTDTHGAIQINVKKDDHLEIFTEEED
ncbi:Metal-dependent hydrolase, beta-lactamase superfamily II [Alkalibacterium subtropicum]|uniref:Metal-dependent hydrolase, beta-lactamase superfamily II n=1 Tax=Alkalibacterium subtropicum TaxID=753702 RepID=A0A1I1EFR1_9LACT|nr:MBL fold metallo-hydrolase [Alkalibacterium subtropicum]SFB84158.1 Metal-dependent hydrolase, beta-lactamase superfamily II [Alkalibacterium subtropicum]